MIIQYSSPSVGNTSLWDGRKICTHKCLIGGTNAVLWTKTVKEIIIQLVHDLGQLSDRRGIILSSARVMLLMCEPETIKEVFNFIKTYPVRI